MNSFDFKITKRCGYMNSFEYEIPIVRGEATTFKPNEEKIKSSKSAY
jgi:hypothetical protein